MNYVICFLKAFGVVVFLLFARELAPIMPAWLLPIIFLIYALTATIGSMYDVVITRLHNQDLYNASGKLSHYNRRWFFWFGGLFVVYLISAILFVLQSPGWDRKEWLLIWAAPFIFFAVFLLMQYILKKEYSAKYYKARAIRGSVIVSALLLTVLYAVVAALPSADIQTSLSVIIQDRYLPFENSPAAFLAELDKLTTYANCLTEYGINKIAGVSYAVSIIVNLIIGFSVFAGVVSLFSACLLNSDEIMSEFKLLPAGDSADAPVQIRYAVILCAIWVVLSGVFVWLNHVAAEIRATDEYTMVDQWIDGTSSWIILAAEEDIEAIKEDVDRIDAAQAFSEAFAQKRDAYIDEQSSQLNALINAYFDDCATKVDSYIEWYGSVAGKAAQMLPFFGDDIAAAEFDSRVVNQVGRVNIDEKYSAYIEGLKQLYDEYWSADELHWMQQQAHIPNSDELIIDMPQTIELWVPWDSKAGEKIAQKTLLGNSNGDDNGNRDDAGASDAKERVLDYVESRRAASLKFIEGIPDAYFIIDF